MRKPPSAASTENQQLEMLRTSLQDTLDALEGVMALNGRLRLHAYAYEHIAWRTARKALDDGKQILSVIPAAKEKR